MVVVACAYAYTKPSLLVRKRVRTRTFVHVGGFGQHTTRTPKKNNTETESHILKRILLNIFKIKL